MKKYLLMMVFFTLTAMALATPPQITKAIKVDSYEEFQRKMGYAQDEGQIEILLEMLLSFRAVLLDGGFDCPFLHEILIDIREELEANGFYIPDADFNALYEQVRWSEFNVTSHSDQSQ